jgi:hypothetical protein
VIGQPAVSHADFDKVAFYVVAHPDDWQLFMNAFEDAANPPTTKIVFVYTTAGGACGPKDTIAKDPHPTPFYLAREAGAQAAARALADANQKGPADPPRTDKVSLKGEDPTQPHVILRYRFRNTVSYFLRLPESGAPNETAFFCCDPNTNGPPTMPCLLTLLPKDEWEKLLPPKTPAGQDTRETLSQRGNGNFPTLTAVDESTTYSSWNDLVLTLRSLVREEAGEVPISGLSFHISDPDPYANRWDNPDHLATGKTMVKVTEDFPEASVTLHCEYWTGQNAQNVSGNDLQNKSAVFAATSLAIADSSYDSTWDYNIPPTHTWWLSRSYSRPLNRSPPTEDPSKNYCDPKWLSSSFPINAAPGILSSSELPSSERMIVPLVNGFPP